MGMTCEGVMSPPASTREALAALGTAEQFFWSALELSFDRGEAAHVRDLTTSLALIRALQTSLGKNGKNGATVAANLLGTFYLDTWTC